MKRTSIPAAIGIGALTSFPVMALSYLAQLGGLPFAPFDLFDWLARTLPGDAITLGIDLMVEAIRAIDIGPTSAVAKPMEQAMALALFVAMGAGFGGALGYIGLRNPSRVTASAIRVGVVLFVGLWMLSISIGVAEAPVLLSGLWLALLMIGWGWSLAWLVKRAGPALANEPEAPLSRREFVRLAGGSIAGLTVGSWGLARVLQSSQPTLPPVAVEPIDPSQPLDSPPASALHARIEPAPGTRSEITANEDFYRIDINTRKPRLDPESWRLELGGLVNNPLILSIDELMAMPSISYYHTLSCISNRIGGDLISTTLWTGVPISHLLEVAGMRSSAQELFIESSDGFYESVPMRDLVNPRTILAYAMNGMALPHENGYPLRIIIPGHYGMKQPKWIVNMEVIDHEGRGYWVERGWSAEAFVRTTSVIDTIAEESYNAENGTLPIGGIGYAGANGIRRVEVQVDDGPWTETQLRAPALGPQTWVQWRYDWPRQAGRHIFRVRALDGNGELQITEPSGVRPDGATGIHEISETI